MRDTTIGMKTDKIEREEQVERAEVSRRENFEKTPQPGVAVYTPFDFRETCFSPSGFLNYIIRYGGGDRKDSTDKRLTKDVAQGGEDGYGHALFPLRKYVLAEADSTAPAAQEVLKKICCFAGSTFTKNEKKYRLSKKAKEGLQNISKAIKCPPAYKVTPHVELIDPSGKVLASNIQLKPLSKDVIITIQDVNIDVISDKGVQAGSVPVFTGRMTLEFFTKTKTNTKNTTILKTIGDNLETLGYIFALENEYRVRMYNTGKKQNFFSAADNKAYQALLNNRVEFVTKTLRYEIVSWKPYENRLRISVDFAQSSKSRQKITNSGLGGIPVENPEVKKAFAQAQQKTQALVKQGQRIITAYSLMDSILVLLQKNNALFSYSLSEWGDEMQYRIVTQYNGVSAAKLESQGDQIKEKKISQGTFFLFRSLLVAAIQTFYKKDTALDKKVYEKILFDEETFKNMLVILDEEAMPNEVGSSYAKGQDVRNTFETIVIDFQVFSKFIHDLYAIYDRVTFDFFIEQMFATLLPSALKASISSQNNETRMYPTIYNNATTFAPSEKKVDESFGEGYSLRFKDINAEELKLDERIPKNSFSVQQRGWNSAVHRELTENQNTQIGPLKFPFIPEVALQAALSNLDADADKLKFALIIDKNSDARTSTFNAQERKIALTTKTDELLNRGIIPIEWYQRSSPKDNLKWRILAEAGETPFAFSKLDDKVLDTLRRQTGGETPFLRNIYSVTFTVVDVLGMEPFRTKVLFYPSFFYGGQGRGKVEDDKFGFAGVYTCDKASITFDNASQRFKTSLNFYYTEEILSDEQLARDAEARAIAPPTTTPTKPGEKIPPKIPRQSTMPPAARIAAVKNSLKIARKRKAEVEKELASWWSKNLGSTAAGAAAGSVIPVIGTLAGAAIGGTVLAKRRALKEQELSLLNTQIANQTERLSDLLEGRES